jgi:hypothetical protein
MCILYWFHMFPHFIGEVYALKGVLEMLKNMWTIDGGS